MSMYSAESSMHARPYRRRRHSTSQFQMHLAVLDARRLVLIIGFNERKRLASRGTSTKRPELRTENWKTRSDSGRKCVALISYIVHNQIRQPDHSHNLSAISLAVYASKVGRNETKATWSESESPLHFEFLLLCRRLRWDSRRRRWNTALGKYKSVCIYEFLCEVPIAGESFARAIIYSENMFTID